METCSHGLSNNKGSRFDLCFFIFPVLARKLLYFLHFLNVLHSLNLAAFSPEMYVFYTSPSTFISIVFNIFCISSQHSQHHQQIEGPGFLHPQHHQFLSGKVGRYLCMHVKKHPHMMVKVQKSHQKPQRQKAICWRGTGNARDAKSQSRKSRINPE